ncbi:transposable element Tcb1 transposase [Trichonephila clavipes]|nr:transposable element Tcb1 transposase [Trichonephila clavipes]
MSFRHHIDDFMRGRIIGKIEEGRKITDVAREFDIYHRVVSRLWKSFKTTGMCSRRHVGGRVRSTTPAEDRYIVLSAERNRRTTAQQVENQFLAASGKQISRKTVARRLRGEGLYARRPVVCVPLTRQHRTARLQWCREHHNWTEQDWACVLFSDESRFSLSSDCRRQLIWRESGTAYRPENIQEIFIGPSNFELPKNMFHLTTTTGEKTFQTSDKSSNGRVQHVRMYGGYFSADRMFHFRQT